MSFYDEAPDVLSDCIAALAERGGIDHLVAVDGRYATYPGDTACSPVDQHAAVMVACRRHNLPLTFHVPAEPWAGGEVEKRTALFAHGLSVAREGDWFWVQDADQFVRTADGLRERLAATDCDVAALTLHDKVIEGIPLEQRAPGMEEDFVLRCLFRAQRITVEVNHYTYIGEGGRVLWCGAKEQMVPALEMPDVIVDHCPDRRSFERRQSKHQYYTHRDDTGLELGDCFRCKSPRKAVKKVAADLRLVRMGRRKVPTGTWFELCAYHARRQEAENVRALRSMGIDKDRAAQGVFENRNGRIQDFEVVA